MQNTWGRALQLSDAAHFSFVIDISVQWIIGKNVGILPKVVECCTKKLLSLMANIKHILLRSY